MSKLLDFLGGGVIKEVGGILDNLTTTKGEKLEAQRKIKEILMQAEVQAQQEVTKRWEADMKSDNWLSKNIRPLICIFLTAIFVVVSIFDGNAGGFVISPAYIPIYQTLLITVYGAYFAGRTIEKIKK
jgi:hypothetical protein|tara:strand:- start:632 stop:1015 length:384 start_codon:yes stop_codon:yes gene_type:complete